MSRKTLAVAGASLAGAAALALTAVVVSRQRAGAWDAKAAASPEPRQAATAPTAEQEKPAAPYKVGRTVRSSNERNKLILQISVEPEHFNRDVMVSLAQQLNRDYADEPRLVAIILDDENIARNYGPISNEFTIFKKAERGEYHLDRTKGVEYIQFSKERGRRTDEVKVTLSPTSTGRAHRERN